MNNDYLVRVSDSLAILYNDRSPMENHHLAASFQLMHSDEYNFMPAMTPKVKVRGNGCKRVYVKGAGVLESTRGWILQAGVGAGHCR